MALIVSICTASAAVMYAVGSFFTKRSMTDGTSSRRATAVTNVAMALWAMPLFFVSRGSFDLSSWLVAIGAGAALFVGRIFSVKALEVGDLSVVGPLLGIKTLLVGLFSFATGQTEMTPTLWLAVVFASLAVILLQRRPRGSEKRSSRAIFYAFAASVLFALTDILVVEARDALGIGWLSPTLFLTVALMIPLLGKLPKEPPQARRSLYAGASIMGFQTSFVVLLIAITGDAVLINIVYSTRALWAVVVDRVAGRKEAVKEQFLERMFGALLLVISVGIVLIER